VSAHAARFSITRKAKALSGHGGEAAANLETAGSGLEKVLKCNVYCTSVEKFEAVNAV